MYSRYWMKTTLCVTSQRKHRSAINTSFTLQRSACLHFTSPYTIAVRGSSYASHHRDLTVRVRQVVPLYVWKTSSSLPSFDPTLYPLRKGTHSRSLCPIRPSHFCRKEIIPPSVRRLGTFIHVTLQMLLVRSWLR